MSSLRVRAQIKVKETIGASKRTTNLPFQTAVQEFEHLEKDVCQLDCALRGFISSIQGMHAAANVLTNAMENIADLPGKGCPGQVKEFVSAVSAITQQVDHETLNQMVNEYQENVLQPSEGWLVQCSDLKERVTKANELHSTYDHYTRKVVAMREHRDKRVSVGKSEKERSVDKLLRNEQKLVISTRKYREESNATIMDLKSFTNNRYNTLSPLMQRVLQFRVHYATSMSIGINGFAGILNNEHSEILQQLNEIASASAKERNALNATDHQEEKSMNFFKKLSAKKQTEPEFTHAPKTVDEFVNTESQCSNQNSSTPTKLRSNKEHFDPFDFSNNNEQYQAAMQAAGVSNLEVQNSLSNSVMDNLFVSPTSSKETKIAHKYSGI